MDDLRHTQELKNTQNDTMIVHLRTNDAEIEAEVLQSEIVGEAAADALNLPPVQFWPNTTSDIGVLIGGTPLDAEQSFRDNEVDDNARLSVVWDEAAHDKALRRMMHGRLLAAFEKWQHYAEQEARRMYMMRGALMRGLRRKLSVAFEKWRFWAEKEHQENFIVLGAMRHLIIRKLSMAFEKWQLWATHKQRERLTFQNAMAYRDHCRLRTGFQKWCRDNTAGAIQRRAMDKATRSSVCKAWLKWRHTCGQVAWAHAQKSRWVKVSTARQTQYQAVRAVSICGGLLGTVKARQRQQEIHREILHLTRALQEKETQNAELQFEVEQMRA